MNLLVDLSLRLLEFVLDWFNLSWVNLVSKIFRALGVLVVLSLDQLRVQVILGSSHFDFLVELFVMDHRGFR